MRDEIDQGIDIRVFAELAACLAAMQEAAPALERDAVTRLLDERIAVEIGEYLSKGGWTTSGSPTMELNVFATENHSRVTISLKAAYPLVDARQEERRAQPAIAKIEATASYDIEANDVVAVDLDSLCIEWIDIDGAPRQKKTIFGRAGLTIGHRIVPLSISSPVEEYSPLP